MNSFTLADEFQRLCTRQLLKTLWGKEKLPLMTDISFCYNVFSSLHLLYPQICRSIGLWTFLVNTISQQPLVRIQYDWLIPSLVIIFIWVMAPWISNTYVYCQAPAGGIHYLSLIFLVILAFKEILHIIIFIFLKLSSAELLYMGNGRKYTALFALFKAV